MDDNKTIKNDGMTGMTMSSPDWYFLKQELPVLLSKSRLNNEAIDEIMDVVYLEQHKLID